MTIEFQHSFVDLPPEIVQEIVGFISPKRDPVVVLPLLLTSRKLGYLRRCLYRNILCLVSATDILVRRTEEKSKEQLPWDGVVFDHRNTAITTSLCSFRKLIATLTLNPHLINYIQSLDIKTINFNTYNRTVHKELENIFQTSPELLKDVSRRVPITQVDLASFEQMSFRNLTCGYFNNSNETNKLGGFHWKEESVHISSGRGACLYAPRSMKNSSLDSKASMFLETMRALVELMPKNPLKNKINIDAYSLSMIMEPSVYMACGLGLPDDYYVLLSFRCYSTRF